MKKWQDNITFVLVEPREAGNIGASARAMKNMGFRRLALVNPVELTDEATWFARNSQDVLKKATAHKSLADAVRKNTVIVGTTRRKGKNRGVIYNADEGAGKIRELAASNKVAILFGREDRGLHNEEVDECAFLLSIPVSKEQPSLNLAQAVLIIAYELSRSEYREEATSSKEITTRISHEELSNLYERVQATLRMLEYIPRGGRDLEKAIMLNLRHFISRAGINKWELNMLHGICTRIERKMGKF